MKLIDNQKKGNILDWRYKTMKGFNVAYCDAAIAALLAANSNLMQTSVKEALGSTVYGKGDTLGLDAIPEIEITSQIGRFDPDAVLVTEEFGKTDTRYWPPHSDPDHQPVIFFCDPTDRSKELGQFLQKYLPSQPSTKVGDLIHQQETKQVWKELASDPLSVTGATSAISCIRQGRIMFSVILNYITQELYIACGAGIFHYQLSAEAIRRPESVNLSEVITNGEAIVFPPLGQLEGAQWDVYKAFVTFLGKTGYLENFRDSMIFIEGSSSQGDGESSSCLHYARPGGPSRILYLSSFQFSQKPIGFILANGEKIGEWIHWLSFVRFAQRNGQLSLILFEIWHERPWTKEGILMSTSPAYSIFQPIQPSSEHSLIDVSQLARFPNPSRFRSTLLIAPSDNQWVLHTMHQHRYRQIHLPPGIPN